MSKHYKLLGIFYLVLGCLTLLSGIFVGSILKTVGVMVDDAQAEKVLGIISAVFPIAMFTISLPNIIAGIGLLYKKYWALIMALVLSILTIFNFPLGTALSIYTIWVFVKKEELEKQDTLTAAN